MSSLESIEQLPELVAWLQAILAGDENSTVTIDGQIKPSVQKSIGDQFSALQAMVQGRIPFDTKSAMDAFGAPTADTNGNLPLAEVWKDPVPANNGAYGWDSSSWALSEYDISNDVNVVSSAVSTLSGEVRQATDMQLGSSDPSIYPLIISESGYVLLGVKSDGALIADASLLDLGANESFRGVAAHADPGLLYEDVSSSEVPIIIDAAGKALLSIDKATGNLKGSFEQSGENNKTARVPVINRSDINYDWNGILTTGQSLGAGYKGYPVVTVAPKYDCLSFANGPRSTKEPSASNFGTLGGTLSLIPHVENTLYGMNGGGDVAQYGESPSAGCAHAVVQFSARESGFSWHDNSHQIVSFNAARGSTPLEQLLPAEDIDYGGDVAEGELFQLIRDQVSEAHGLAVTAGKTFAVHAVVFVQGEGNASQEVGGVSQDQYLARLRRYRDYINTYIKSVTGQAHDIVFLTYQTYRSTGEQTVIQSAQLDIGNDDNSYFVTPIYHIPMYSISDGHFSAEGSYIFGQYCGRAYVDAVINGVQPKYLKPLTAVVEGVTLSVRFDVPTLPMVLDEVNLAATQDYGFAVYVDDVRVAVDSVEVSSSGDVVLITLVQAPVGVVVVRYAHDYLAAGLTHYGSDLSDRGNNPASCSGNLRDSTPDKCSVPSGDFNMWHVAPHFVMPVISI